MDFGTAVIFLFLYFIRPQDWMPGIAGLNVIKPLVVIGLFALFTRPQGFAQGIKSIMRTPHDWIVVVYSSYILYTAPDFSDAFWEVFPLVAFYFLTTLALDTPERLAAYLKWWMIFLIAVAALAAASLIGIDFTGAAVHTAQNKGRLCLNTWMLDNPNALGHTVIVAIPMIYFFFCWRRNAGGWMVALPFFALCLCCVYFTESKGAYLSGTAAITGALLFGKSRTFQIFSIVLLLTAGGSLLSALPRMQDMSGIKSDEGVQGRVMAWEIARTSFRGHTTGEGLKKFQAYIKWEGEMERKATHSSYIQIAADLGPPGLFLYLLMLAAGMHTLCKVKGSLETMERSRRLLFAMLLAFMISSWMIQRPYHAEFFTMMAAIAAYHHLEARARLGERIDAVDPSEILLPWQRPRTAPALGPAADPSPYAAPRSFPVAEKAAVAAVVAAKVTDSGREMAATGLQPLWTRPVMTEIVLTFLLYQGVIATWDFVLATF